MLAIYDAGAWRRGVIVETPMPTTRPTISVIIPAYNEEKYIARCIASLQKQRVMPLEIIVVNNNSIDATKAIAQSMGIRVIDETRPGISYARNAGFNAAKGDILARLDADCIAPPTWIQQISDIYTDTRNHNEAISGTGRYYMPRMQFLGTLIGYAVAFGFYAGTYVLLRHTTLYGSCMALPRSIWDRVASEVCLDSEVVHEDIDLGAHLCLNHFSVRFVPKFYTYVDTRSLKESPRKTFWRLKIWPESARRHLRNS